MMAITTSTSTSVRPGLALCVIMHACCVLPQADRVPPGRSGDKNLHAGRDGHSLKVTRLQPLGVIKG